MMPTLHMRYTSSVLKVSGYILFALGVGMIPSLLFDVFNGFPLETFLWPGLFCLVLSAILIPFTKLPKMIRPVDGIVMIAIVWFIAIMIGTLPFVMVGMDFIDGFFESTSGFTTTGSTIMDDIESWSPGILLWRSMMQWMGGIAIIMIFMFLLPSIGIGGREFFGNETSGSGTGTFTAKMRDSAIQFSLIYFALTMIMFVLVLLSGVNLLDALCLSFSTISTGGFMCRNDSLASFSPVVKVIAAMFMFLGGTNFYLHFQAMKNKDPSQHIQNEEFKWMFIWTAAMIVIACFLLIWNPNTAVADNDFFDIFLNMVSAVTTTGFSASEYSNWYTPAIALLFIAMIVGASSGSTSGGIKIGRILIVFRFIYNGIQTNIHPKGVSEVRLNGSTVDSSGVSSALTVFILFFVTLSVGGFALMFCGLDFSSAFTIVIANITTFGPAVGNYGSFGSYESLEWYAKAILCAVMWLGRLEILTGLVMLTPSFWKEFMMSRRKKLGKGFNVIKFRR